MGDIDKTAIPSFDSCIISAAQLLREAPLQGRPDSMLALDAIACSWIGLANLIHLKESDI